MRRSLAATCVLVLGAAACSASVGTTPSNEAPAPDIQWPTSADTGAELPATDDFDRTAFAAFIATTPTEAQFRAAYPDVVVVMPNSMATTDFRSDHSRFFAAINDEGHISGGRFQ